MEFEPAGDTGVQRQVQRQVQRRKDDRDGRTEKGTETERIREKSSGDRSSDSCAVLLPLRRMAVGFRYR